MKVPIAITIVFATLSTMLPSTVCGKDVKTSFVADFRLVRDTPFGGSRYAYGEEDRLFFDLANTGIAFDMNIDNLSSIHFAFNVDSSIQKGDSTSSIDEAWYYKNELIGKLGARFGIFPLPFSREHKGPFNSTVRSISPSVINSFFNSFRVTGLELKKGYKVPGKHFDWRFGIATGMDTVSFAHREMRYSDWRHSEVSPSTDGSSGIFGYIGKNHSNSCKRGKLSWHGGFLLNYGNDEAEAPSGDTKLLLMDFSYEEGKFGFLFQGLAGHTNYDTHSRESVEINFSKAWWTFHKKLEICARYDNWFTDNRYSDKTDEGHGYTGTVSYKRNSRETIQLEYLLARVSTGTIETAPLWQARYLVFF